MTSRGTHKRNHIHSSSRDSPTTASHHCLQDTILAPRRLLRSVRLSRLPAPTRWPRSRHRDASREGRATAYPHARLEPPPQQQSAAGTLPLLASAAADLRAGHSLAGRPPSHNPPGQRHKTQATTTADLASVSHLCPGPSPALLHPNRPIFGSLVGLITADAGARHRQPDAASPRLRSVPRQRLS